MPGLGSLSTYDSVAYPVVSRTRRPLHQHRSVWRRLAKLRFWNSTFHRLHHLVLSFPGAGLLTFSLSGQVPFFFVLNTSTVNDHEGNQPDHGPVNFFLPNLCKWYLLQIHPLNRQNLHRWTINLLEREMLQLFRQPGGKGQQVTDDIERPAF